MMTSRLAVMMVDVSRSVMTAGPVTQSPGFMSPRETTEACWKRPSWTSKISRMPRTVAVPAFPTLLILAGGVTCAAFLRPGRENWFYGTALACVALGAWLDSGATSLTRPHDIRLSQALVAYVRNPRLHLC